MKNLSLMVRYVFTTPWCPVNRLLWYSVIILSVHDSGTTKTAVSLSEEILNNSESSRTYFSASASVFLIASLEDGNLFWDKYKYNSLKYGLCMYPQKLGLDGRHHLGSRDWCLPSCHSHCLWNAHGCFSCFYFHPSRNFLWQVGCLVNCMIDGIRFLSFWSSSSLTYTWPFHASLFG